MNRKRTTSRCVFFSLHSIARNGRDGALEETNQLVGEILMFFCFVVFLFGRVEATKEKRLDGECLLIDQERLRAKNKEKEKREKQRTDGRKE